MTVVDFRFPRWGHNLLATRETKNGEYSGLAISTPLVKEGDIIRWKTRYGYAEAAVSESIPKIDPYDMTSFTAKVINRIADPEVVSQEEIDEYFKDR